LQHTGEKKLIGIISKKNDIRVGDKGNSLEVHCFEINEKWVLWIF
jgi:hypothetical protein